MATLYILTGPPGVGKSTISKRLAENLSKSVLIDGDDIYHHVVGGYVAPYQEGNHLDVFWRVVYSTIREYLNDGYDVVFNYIVNPKDLENLQKNVSNHFIKFVVLMATKDTLMKRDQERELDSQMGERCLVLLKEFQEYSYPKDFSFYTDSISIEEIVHKIVEDNNYMIGD